METGWIKLYRKSRENPLMRDANAWMVFTWILLTVKKETGEVIIGRFWLSEILKLKPTTLYKVIKRLEKKYKVVTLSSNNKNTVVSVLNWSKYQYKPESVTLAGNIKVTTKGQQSNTIQEVKNGEVKNITKVIHGNEDINETLSYLQEKLKLPKLDESVKVNRQYMQLLLKKFGGAEKIKLLVDATAQHDFWSTRITSTKQLYYKAVQIISSGRNSKMGVTKI